MEASHHCPYMLLVLFTCLFCFVHMFCSHALLSEASPHCCIRVYFLCVSWNNTLVSEASPLVQHPSVLQLILSTEKKRCTKQNASVTILVHLLKRWLLWLLWLANPCFLRWRKKCWRWCFEWRSYFERSKHSSTSSWIFLWRTWWRWRQCSR